MTRAYRNYWGVGRHVGFVLIILSIAAWITAVVGFLFERMASGPTSRFFEPWALFVSAGISTLVGVWVHRFGKRHSAKIVTRREATLAVGTSWIFVGIFAAMPFALGAGMSPVDAYFEAISGLTTTGATIITDIEARLSPQLLLWRSVIQWLGGMGIIVLFVAVFPTIGAGGKHMFGEEVPGTTAEGLKPRISETSRVLWLIYSFFTAVVAVSLRLLGLSWFEAICHALTTMSTGGFSTRDASVGAFGHPGIETAIAFFMVLASINYGLFYAALRGRSFGGFFRSIEFRVFVTLVLGCTVILTAGTLERHEYDVVVALRHAFFQVGTFVSSTGYTTDDYMAYPPPVLMVVLFLMFCGGCAGSTAGGIKIERMILMAKVSWTQIRRSFRPNLVHVVRMGDKVVTQSALTEVPVFLMIFMASLALGAGFVTVVEGISVPGALGAALTCLSNMGPAPFYAESDNFASYSASSKMVCVVLMLLGRLEFFTLLALCVPQFWKR